jgi:hypothetical protein
MGEVERFGYVIWTELQSAIYQVALDPSKETKEWLVTVGTLWAKKEKRHNELRAKSSQHKLASRSRRDTLIAEMRKKTGNPNWMPTQHVVS